MELWNQDLQKFNLGTLVDCFKESHAIKVGAKKYEFFSPIDDFVLAYECHFENGNVIHSLNNIYATAGKCKKGGDYAYWLHKRDFNKWSNQNNESKVYRPIEEFHLSSIIDISAYVLINIHNDSASYILLWMYLVASQLKCKIDNSIFKDHPQRSEIINTINILTTQILSNINFNDTDILKAIKHKKWIMPTGILYSKNGISNGSINSDDIVNLIFNEITFIKANYQMCFCRVRYY